MNDCIDRLTATGSTFIARDYFGPAHDRAAFDLGYRVMLDAVLDGGQANLPAVLLLARAADTQRGGEPDQARGAMEALLACLDALQAGGKRLDVTDATAWPPMAVRALAVSGPMRRAMLMAMPEADYAGALELVCQAARAAGKFLQRAEPPALPAPPAPAPQIINVELQMPPGAMPVAIVSQPATRSVQTVERDANDEIVRTVTETTPVLAAA